MTSAKNTGVIASNRGARAGIKAVPPSPATTGLDLAKQAARLVFTSVQDMQSGLWNYGADDLPVLRLARSTAESLGHRTRVKLLSSTIRRLEKEGPAEPVIARFQRSRWSPTRRKIDAMGPGESATLPLEQYNTCQSSVQRLQDAYRGKRRWKVSQAGGKTTVTRVK